MEQNPQYKFTSSHCTEQSLLNQHCHTQYELIFVCTGEININVEGTEHTVKKNQGILLPPKIFHTLYGTDSLYERLVITFNDRFVPEEIQSKFASETHGAVIVRNSAAAHLLKRLARYVADENPAFRPLMNAMLTEFVYGIAIEDPGNNERDAQSRNPVIAQITELINNNLDKSITIDFIARSLYMSRSSVSHIFKDCMQTSVKQYVLNKKITWAEELMDGGKSPCDVAKQLGYENYSAFYKMFLQIVGCPPSQRSRKSGK